MSLFKHGRIQQYEADALNQLFVAFETSRKRHLVDEDDEGLVLSGDGAALSAVNSAARLCWAYSLCEEMDCCLDYDDGLRSINQPVFLATFVDIRCARGSNEFGVDLKPIIKRLRKGLRGCNYIGVIEPGLYSYISTVGANLDRSQCISWHLHALVWGAGENRLKNLAAELNRTKKYIPISPDQTGVDVRRVRDRELPQTLAYLFKRQNEAYRLSRSERPDSPGDIRHHQYKSHLRPGECLTIYLQMRHLSLSDLWIASGDGQPILAATKLRCRSAIRRYEQVFSGKSPPVERKRNLFDLVNDQ
ncbi:hypothetical protein [Bradyrhizobium sp. S3.2.12]|uniref:hypothetical protein n=1 Tax=Bradyrhizobium sp. S3.2.12 TaxID=3156387 RepID=UPI003391F62F